MKKLIYTIMVSALLTSCATFAPLSPMVTYGGPETTAKGTSETVVAVGSGFSNNNSGAQGWFGRYKYGLSNKWDLGIDAMGISYQSNFALTTKLAARYQLCPNFRLEGGVGYGMANDGQSINYDAAITWGTLHKDKTWNYYASLRGGSASGFALNDGSSAPADAMAGLINLGAQAKLSDNMKFIFEGGYGYIFVQNQKAAATYYLSCGLLFNFGNMKK